ncbi:MAG: hypothetical protein AB8G05_07425 [Oligoflexales bacterium]
MILKTGIGLGLVISTLFGVPPSQVPGPSIIEVPLAKSEKTSNIQFQQAETKPRRPSYEADYFEKVQLRPSANLDTRYYELGFRPLKSSATSSSTEKLAFADSLNIPYKTLRKKDKLLPIPAWQDRLEFNFGCLSKQAFQALKNHYGSWYSSSSELRYDQNKVYKLADFLPPVVRELSGTRFKPSNKKLPEFIWNMASSPLKKQQKTQSSLYSNCWGIAYEALRGAEDFQIFYARPDWILDTLRQNSQLLARADDATSFPNPRTLKTGDIVLISHLAGSKEYFDHTAIVIDSGIYFEKAGSGAQTPIRFIEQKNLFSVWKPGVFKYEWRRSNQGVKWQDPRKLFSLNTKKFLRRFPGLKKMPKTFLEKHSADWQEEEDGSIYLSFYDMRSINPKGS